MSATPTPGTGSHKRATVHAVQRPFSRIPDELLEEVLVYVCYLGPIRPRVTYDWDTGEIHPAEDSEVLGTQFPFHSNEPECALWRLGWVSTRWRRIIRSYTQLFSFIIVDPGCEPPFPNTGMMDKWTRAKEVALTCLALSKERPLNIMFTYPDRMWPDDPVTLDKRYLQQFLATSHRWKHVMFSHSLLSILNRPMLPGPPSPDSERPSERVGAILPSSLPMAEVLQVGDPSDDPNGYFTPDDIWSYFPSTPSVRRLQVTNITWLHTSWSTSSIHWFRLTHFTSLRCAYVKTGFETLLVNTPNLISFSSIWDEICFERWQQWKTSIYLPHLQSIVFATRSEDHFRHALLSRIECPNLVSLSFQGTLVSAEDDDDGPIVSPCHLSGVAAGSLDPSQKALTFTWGVSAKEFRGMPKLEELTLLHSGGSRSDIYELLADFHRILLLQNLLPRLHTIRLHTLSIPVDLVFIPFEELVDDFEDKGYRRLGIKEIHITKLECTERSFESLKEQADRWDIALKIREWRGIGQRAQHERYWRALGRGPEARYPFEYL